MDVAAEDDLRYMYRLMVFLSLFLGIGFASLRCKKKNVPLNIIGFLDMLVIALILYLAIGVAFITSGGKGLGLSATGAALGVTIAVLIMSRITPQYKKQFMDSFFIAMPLMYGLGKIGCASAGCCQGLPYNGLFKVMGRDMEYVFPVQALEAVVFIALFLLAVFADIKERYNPVIAAYIYAFAKIMLDFLRYTHVDHIISINQIMVTAMVVALFVWQIITGMKNKSLSPH